MENSSRSLKSLIVSKDASSLLRSSTTPLMRSMTFSLVRRSSALDALLRGKCLDVVGVDGYERRQILLTVADDADLGNVFGGGDEALDGRGSHVLAA